MKTIRKLYTDPDFGGVSIPKTVGSIFLIVAIVFLWIIIFGGGNQCHEETAPNGHTFTVCYDGKYNTFREHSAECLVLGCPYAITETDSPTSRAK